MSERSPRDSAARLNERFRDNIIGNLGIETTRVEPDCCEGRLPIRAEFIAGTGFLWAPMQVALADALCAWGAGCHTPEGGSFTTVEQKTNFFATARDGTLLGRATPAHIGRTTQVWDCQISHEESGRVLCLYRCTQLVLQPRGG